MGAVPNSKVSRHRRGNRRRYQVIKPPFLVTCTHCGELKRAHRVCKTCGTYKERQIITMKKKETVE
jgi:large subunit ribosomal protein L32